MDLNTGLLKNYVGEMNRRPAGFYVPPVSDGFRQGTENSHANLVDLRTGLLLQHSSEMQRGLIAVESRLGRSDEYRHGIENSHPQTSSDEYQHGIEYARSQISLDEYQHGIEYARSQISLDEYQHGIEYARSQISLDEYQHGIEYARSQISLDEYKHGIEYSWFKNRDAQRKDTVKDVDVVAVPLAEGGWVRGALGLDHPEQVRRAEPEENRRQGTEPSRRFLVDLNTGLLKNYVGEMNRRPAGFYVPPVSDGFRQGTENSHANLVDLRTGLLLQHSSEMQRGLIAVESVRSERRQKAEGVRTVEPEENRRQGTEPSRRFLMDLNTGLLKNYVGEMNRRPAGFYVPPVSDGFRQGTENSHANLVDLRTGLLLQHSSEMQRGLIAVESVRSEKRQSAEGVRTVEPEENRRQGTEPSRRFLMDLNTGLLKNYVGEMNRRPSGFYVPPVSDGFRQGTENSHANLVDLRTGLLLQHSSEMQRGLIAELTRPALDEFKHGIEYSHFQMRDHRQNEIMEVVDKTGDEFSHGIEYSHSNVVNDIVKPAEKTEGDEFSNGIEYSHFNLGNDIMEPAEKTENSVWLRETLPVAVTCSGEIINGMCYQFNPTPMTFSQAESSCQDLHSEAHIASVTSAGLHTRLVSMVTVANNSPALTWVGGVKKGQQYEWLDGSVWAYSDWMPGHPNLQRGKVMCVEMFRAEASWWTSVDCNLKRASICSFPMAA
ncbi:uncharacterized protein wu:fa56d06 [Engraulis encrasicolus]|uniref:uncharacterized protein wu:fa56d06 n=1 Tax=Engraulis encrasicolus TaxID=184585 RepID=UPI002FD71576